ncbi:MAG: hypothetical protein ABIX00_10560 [Polaromonas sp.]
MAAFAHVMENLQVIGSPWFLPTPIAAAYCSSLRPPSAPVHSPCRPQRRIAVRCRPTPACEVADSQAGQSH